jgi:hypothetical protein
MTIVPKLAILCFFAFALACTYAPELVADIPEEIRQIVMGGLFLFALTTLFIWAFAAKMSGKFKGDDK